MILKNKSLLYVAIAVAGVSSLTGFVSYRAIARYETTQQWQPLSGLVSAERLAGIVAENNAPSAGRAEIAASSVGYEQGDLLLVDFNTPELCGIGGCALAGYQPSTGERILAVYVQRASLNEPIVEVVNRSGFELPCLLVPPDLEDENIFAETDKDILCYQNGSWSIR